MSTCLLPVALSSAMMFKAQPKAQTHCLPPKPKLKNLLYPQIHIYMHEHACILSFTYLAELSSQPLELLLQL